MRQEQYALLIRNVSRTNKINRCLTPASACSFDKGISFMNLEDKSVPNSCLCIEDYGHDHIYQQVNSFRAFTMPTESFPRSVVLDSHYINLLALAKTKTSSLIVTILSYACLVLLPDGILVMNPKKIKISWRNQIKSSFS